MNLMVCTIYLIRSSISYPFLSSISYPFFYLSPFIPVASFIHKQPYYMAWNKEKGIYHPRNNPNKSIPYIRWIHPVKVDFLAYYSESVLDDWIESNEFFVSISKWQETYSVEILRFCDRQRLYLFSFLRKISPKEFESSKYEYVGQVFSKAKEMIRSDFAEDMHDRESFDFWDEA